MIVVPTKMVFGGLKMMLSILVNYLQTPEEDSAYLDLRQENEELLRRLAAVQQQMWTLEEKVTQ